MCSFHLENSFDWSKIWHALLHEFGIKTSNQRRAYNNSTTGADPEGGAPGARPPLKLEKIWFFLRKIVIFHTKYPKTFRASIRSAQFL